MSPTEPTAGTSPAWSPHFPHAHIDALLAQLREAEGCDLPAARAVLLRVAEEAERLRRTVAELASRRLAEAEAEAEALIGDAARTAQELRAAGRAALDARLAECEQLSMATRDLLRQEAEEADPLVPSPRRPPSAPPVTRTEAPR